MANTSPLRGSITIPRLASSIAPPLTDAAVASADHLAAGIRLFPLHDLNRPTQRIDLDALTTIGSAQVVVQEPLQTGLPDQVTAAVPPVFHLLLAHLSHVAEQVRGEGRREVHALGLDLDDHTGQLGLSLLHPGHFLERKAPAHADGTVRFRRHAVKRGAQLRERNAEQHRQTREHGVAIVHLARHEREREGRAIVDEGQAVPVEENAPRCGDRADANAVLVRHFLKASAFERLEIPELTQKNGEPEAGYDRQGQHTATPGVARPAGELS
jgi:hypothetical protein